jgi:hypothetical protein
MFRSWVFGKFALVAAFLLNAVAIMLPWRVKIVYLSLLRDASNLLMRSPFLIEFFQDQAYAQASDKELLLRT